MPKLKILEFPDPRLRTQAKPVISVDDIIRNTIDDMFDTMYDSGGIGLAATQVDIHQRIIVIDVSDDRNEPQVFINPEITVLDETLSNYDEGCLSVPGFNEMVERPKKVKIDALNKWGKPFSIEPEGILAICIQHEIDHLNGKLFVDYLSPVKRNRIRSKLEKQHRVQS